MSRITFIFGVVKVALNKIFKRKSKQKFTHLVIIDPGHGGSKPGAISRDGEVKEKDINLSVARLVGFYVKKNKLPFEVHLTRQDDYDISLKDRCYYANETWKSWWSGISQQHCAFVSIHCNARNPTGKHGLEIESYHHQNSIAGRALVMCLQKSLLSTMTIVAKIPVFDRGVKLGKRWSVKHQKWYDFYVLKHTMMSSGLVELGFISDNEEAKLLNNSENQKAFARAIARGIERFFNFYRS